MTTHRKACEMSIRCCSVRAEMTYLPPCETGTDHRRGDDKGVEVETVGNPEGDLSVSVYGSLCRGRFRMD